MNSFYWVFYTLFKSISKAFFSWKVVNREKLIEDARLSPLTRKTRMPPASST